MSKASGALLMIVGILLTIYAVLQFIISPYKNGIEKARRESTKVFGIPLPPIARVLSIIALILIIIVAALVFIIGKIYYSSE